jgi:S-adenosylmethionine decarboxylase proenzyme
MSNLLGGPSVGVHLLVNVYDVRHIERLQYLARGRPLLDEIVRELRLHVVAQAGHQFPPVGYTYAYVLSESHFTIHTYPEHQSCYIDIFCCDPDFSPTRAIHLIQCAFDTESVRYQVIQR